MNQTMFEKGRLEGQRQLIRSMIEDRKDRTSFAVSHHLPVSNVKTFSPSLWIRPLVTWNCSPIGVTTRGDARTFPSATIAKPAISS